MNTSAGLVCETALQIAKELGIPLVKECEELLALIPLNPP
jgi:hypothetical protein